MYEHTTTGQARSLREQHGDQGCADLAAGYAAWLETLDAPAGQDADAPTIAERAANGRGLDAALLVPASPNARVRGPRSRRNVARMADAGTAGRWAHKDAAEHGQATHVCDAPRVDRETAQQWGQRQDAQPATERQLNYINRLMADRVDDGRISDEQRLTAMQRLSQGITKVVASKWITRLLDMPAFSAAQLASASQMHDRQAMDDRSVARTMAHGTASWTVFRQAAQAVLDSRDALQRADGTAKVRFALADQPDRTGQLVTKFFHLRKSSQGKFYLEEFVAGGHTYLIRDLARAVSVMQLVSDEHMLKNAMLRYGQELGACGHCGRTLTNETSRELGIGPVCMSRMGW